jgi:hypothetical protein
MRFLCLDPTRPQLFIHDVWRKHEDEEAGEQVLLQSGRDVPWLFDGATASRKAVNPKDIGVREDMDFCWM